MNFKKSKRYSNFTYTPRFYDENKINWTLRKKDIENKVLNQGHSYHDFINFRSSDPKAKLRKLIILGGILSVLIAIPLMYGLGTYQLGSMVLVATGFIKMSNLLK
jgi:hypothetical protein